MKLSKKDASMLVGLAGVLFVVAIWYLVVSPLQTKTKTLETENNDLKTKAELYQTVNANLATYEEGIASMSAEIMEIGNHYPVYISREDEIMFLSNMEDSYPEDIAVQTISMQPFVEITTTQGGSTPEGGVPVRMFKQPTTYSFDVTYDGMKDMITYLVENSNKKSIDQITLSVNAEKGIVTGSMVLNQFYMTGIEGKEYKAIMIPSVRKGVDDVFHTVESAGGVKINVSVNPQTSDDATEGDAEADSKADTKDKKNE